MARASFDEREDKAMALLSNSLDDAPALLVTSAQTSAEVWSKLIAHYESSSVDRIVELQRSLMSLKLAENGDMSAHISEFKCLHEQLAAVGNKVKEVEMVFRLFATLPASYNTFVSAFGTRKTEDLTWDYVTSRLLSEFYRIKEQRAKEGNSALASFNRNQRFQASRPQGNSQQQQHNFANNSRGHGRGGNQSSRGFARGGYRQGSKGNCHECNEPGHHWNRCPKLQSKYKANYVHGQQPHHRALWGANANLFSNVQGETEDWYIDSAASAHITFRKDWLNDYEPFPAPEIVELGDDFAVEAYGKGSVNFDLKGPCKGEVASMGNVLFVPRMAKNLVSVGALGENRSTSIFDGKTCQITKNGELMAKGQFQDKVYPLDGSVGQSSVTHVEMWL